MRDSCYPSHLYPRRTSTSSVREYSLHHIHIIQLSRTRIHRLQQLINLLIAHLLAQIRENVSELPNADEACQVFVEDLEAATVLFWLAGVAEATWAVEDAREGVEVDYTTIKPKSV